jgi:hypothetical protein
MIPRRFGIGLLTAATITVAAAAFLAPRTPQPLVYHHFADQRQWLGIPRFGDVTSNLAFVVVGVCGVIFLTGSSGRKQFLDVRERYPYLLVFAGLLLTAFGSTYYHLAPDNARLVWDRLPMTLVFMSLVAAMIAERISIRFGLYVWPLLLVLGAGSVLQWYWSEQHGTGDLRFYAAVQVYAMVVLLPARYTRTADLAAIAGLYVLAKILESSDGAIFSFGHFVSGHTLSHLAAAGAGYWIFRMLQKRRPIARKALNSLRPSCAMLA